MRVRCAMAYLKPLWLSGFDRRAICRDVFAPIRCNVLLRPESCHTHAAHTACRSTRATG